MSAGQPTPTQDEQLAGAADQKRRFRNGLIALVMLVVFAASLIAAVPGLHGVGQLLGRMSTGWMALAVVLELLSGYGYVLSFAVVFPRGPLQFTARMAWLHFVARVAWLEQGFGAVVPAGGAGAEVPGAVVLHARGMPWGWVAERSAVLFLLTSAINVFALALFGLGLAIGILPGPSNPLLGVLPAAVGIGVLAFFLALPRGLDRLLARRDWHRLPARTLNGLTESIRDVERIVFARDWRLIGPVGYLAFDIAVLWACFRALGHSPPLASLVLGYQIGYLSNLIPVPGGVGVLDGGLIGALVLYGANATTAAAAVLAYHAIALAVPVAFSLLALLLLRPTFKQPPRRSDPPAKR